MTNRPRGVRGSADVSATLEQDLRENVDGEVRFDAGTRSAYSTDASNFRQVPIGVVIPRSVEAATRAIAIAHAHHAPVVSRGGGTSLAGQCTNEAVMVDWAKYCNALLSVDRDSRSALVEPGIVLDELNRQLAQYSLRFGPEPATHPNCTLGGMIDNNSCGATAQRTGKVVDNILRLEVLLIDGTRFWCGPTTDADYEQIEHHGDRRASIYRTLRRLRDDYGDDIRERFPDIPRRVSGYNLDSLLPGHGFDVGAFLVGSESTLVTVLRAELKLVPVVPTRGLVVLGYPDIASAADDVPRILPAEPIALEGLDDRLINDERIQHLDDPGRQRLPEGRAYLMVQFGGKDREEIDARAVGLLERLGLRQNDPHVSVLDDPGLEDELWAVRESGLGASAHVPGEPDAWAGWEDAAVAPERLGDYLRDLERLYERFGYAGDTAPSIYGHFGQGCVHSRIPFVLRTADGIEKYRRFMEAAADLVAGYGGSFSGEHGDGQARGELLPRMFGTRIMRAFAEVKTLFDPENLMNPGKVVQPARLDEHLRLGADWTPSVAGSVQFSYPEDDGSFVAAAGRCVGVGLCRAPHTEGADVMCPSYRATREEEHSTRGRSRLLFEMLDGHADGVIKDGWRSTAVLHALDLCLSCKGCAKDCPVNVDMATYKAEFLSHHYERRLRPRSHYTLGWLPVLGAAVSRANAGRVVNAVALHPFPRRIATRLAGVEDRRLPQFASTTLQQWWAGRGSSGAGAKAASARTRGTVLLWPDTFTNNFGPHIGQAAVTVLEAAGWRVEMPSGPLCCGLTWNSTGQLKTARRVLRHTAGRLGPWLHNGTPIVGLEPSCTEMLRSDARRLLPDDVDVRRMAEQTVSLAELLHDRSGGWRAPAGPPAKALVQVHCHQHAGVGWEADHELLRESGVEANSIGGCCGLAGNFGFERGHMEVSRACAEDRLLPAIRDADDDTLIMADGFSCRTQLAELGPPGRVALHLAEVLAGRLGPTTATGRQSRASAPDSAR